VPGPALAFLVRHARAEPSAGGGDAARRLTGEGRRDFEARLRALGPELALRLVVTSPLARARQTADLLSRATGAPVEEEPRLASGASDGHALLGLLRSLGPGVALVGHNPEVAEAVALAGGAEREVAPGAVAALDADGRLAWLR
jgi:phosphohistidine phosphatase